MGKLAEDALVSLARKHADRKGLPASLVYAMILAESSGHPEAASRKGALGLMQMQGPTAESLGYKHEEMANPDKAVEAGTTYLDKLLTRFEDDPHLALSGYNAGPTKTRRMGGVVPATQPYIDKISKTVADLTAEGQPFYDETIVPKVLAPQRIERSQRIADLVEKIKAPQRAEKKYSFLKGLFGKLF